MIYLRGTCDGLMISKLNLHGEETNLLERHIVDCEQSGLHSGYFCSTAQGETSFAASECVLGLHPMTFDPGGSQFLESAWGPAEFLGGRMS